MPTLGQKLQRITATAKDLTSLSQRHMVSTFGRKFDVGTVQT